jgi:class 3 adenylate cyclase/tetratricopeptide (TPR) repeat protein
VTAGLICSTCGSENANTADFCRSCGSSLARGPQPRGEARKIVTVLFSDVTGSTLLGEQLDPESFRRIMSRYFDEMRLLLERHSGTVEKFIGDAVMAVFGVPRTHEDDALRAVRAANEIGQVVDALNDEFRTTWDVTLSTRTGVNTGEVSTVQAAEGHPLVAGDAVNVAARLEQMAAAGEVLIGDATLQLVRDAVVAERVAPLTVKGKSREVAAWRLLDVSAAVDSPSRHLGSPLVGREEELRRLEVAFEETEREPSCRLVTILGSAGVGKSRLTREFTASIQDRAIVAEGRCLPYGDGITFWPIVGVLRELAGIDERDAPEQARSKIEGLVAMLDDRTLSPRVAGLLGLAEATPGMQQTFWAVRKVFEQLASRRPAVLIFEDIQWGEATFLDLLDYLADRVTEAPVLILCLARPELLDLRPGWMAGKSQSSMLRLEPLDETATGGLIANLIGGGDLPTEANDRIAQLAEGNPLFIEETLRMLVDDGVLLPVDGGWAVVGDISALAIPPTIHALLAARLDRLDAEELMVIERASVAGRVFAWGAVSELTPIDVRPRVLRHLQTLTRKELIRPDYSAAGQEDSFRFNHLLIRDGAYQQIPKVTRAELHGRLADWMEAETRGQVGEYEEIVGYHLEQAYRLLREIGRVNEEIEGQGNRASDLLASAGMRAFAREDTPAAISLLSRAAALLPSDDRARLEILPQLAFALMDAADFERLQQVVGEAGQAAEACDDARLRAHTQILELWIRLFTNPEGWAEEAEREARNALATFEEHGDERGLAKGWALLGLVNVTRGQFEYAEDAWTEAAHFAGGAGARREELEALAWVLLSVWAGPRPALEGRKRCKEVLDRAGGDHKGMASALFMAAVFEACLNNASEAQRLLEEARGLLEEVGLNVWLAGPFAQMAGMTNLTLGDTVAAERELRTGYEQLERIGEMAWLPTVVALLAEAVYAQGRYDEAEELTALSEKWAGSEDASSQVIWRAVRARLLARGGAGGDGLQLAEEARAIADSTDSPEIRARALLAHADVLRLSGEGDDARPLVRQAVTLLERKGNAAWAERARHLVR